MDYLLQDIPQHAKRAAIAPYLMHFDIPDEFAHDEGLVLLFLIFRVFIIGISLLSTQFQELQDQFKEAHKYNEQLKQPGNSASSLKREIQLMEEEKQQVISKINRMKKNVESVVYIKIILTLCIKLFYYSQIIKCCLM